MWCAKCQSDVAVEARPNSQRLHCATCGTEISPRLNQPAQPPAAKGNPAEGRPAAESKTPSPTRNPQELLARWAGSQMFDPYGPIVTPGARAAEAKPEVSKPEVPKPVAPTPVAREVPSAPVPLVANTNPAPIANPTETLDKSAKLRVDPAFTEGWSGMPSPHVAEPSQGHSTGTAIPAEREVASNSRVHAPSGLRGPHFNPSRIQTPPPKSFRAAAVFGQLLAYAGAATLTGGAGLVLWGYLGGPTHLAPTGWFTTTIGQMLLFMGVVTLVSAGMEQTTAEVSRRVDSIAEQLTRLEYATAQAASAAADAEIEAQLRAEIAELRKQLSGRKS